MLLPGGAWGVLSLPCGLCTLVPHQAAQCCIQASEGRGRVTGSCTGKGPSSMCAPKANPAVSSTLLILDTLALVLGTVTARSSLVSRSQTSSVLWRGGTPAPAGCGGGLSSGLCWGVTSASPPSCVWVPGEGLILSVLQSGGASYPWGLILSLNVVVSLHLILHPRLMPVPALLVCDAGSRP